MRFAFAGAIVGTAGLVWLIGWDAGIRTAGIAPYTSGANYTLSVLPMFILIGYLAYYAGITQSAFEAARRWFGWLPGGLATGTVFAVAGFSAVSGASSAAAAVFAKVAIPEMLKAKYDKRLAAGVCAAGATLDSLIPPSTLLVVYGIITEQSIGKLLIAGFVPGIVSALVYAADHHLALLAQARARPAHHAATPGRSASSRCPARTPIFLVILIIFFSMYFGWATPTEAGALGAFCGVRLRAQERHQARRAAPVPARFGAAHGDDLHGDLGRADLRALPRLLRHAGGVSRWVTDLDVPPLAILLAIYLLYFVLGTVLEGIGMFLLTLPVVFPVIVSLGYDPIWFGIVLVKLSGIASLSPPVGLVVFVVNGVRPDISVRDIFKGIWPFIFADIITLGVLTAFPEIVTFIVETAD